MEDISWMTEREKHVRMGQANGSSTFMAWKTCRSLLRASAGNLRYISIHRLKTMCISSTWRCIRTWYIPSSSREKHFFSIIFFKFTISSLTPLLIITSFFSLLPLFNPRYIYIALVIIFPAFPFLSLHFTYFIIFHSFLSL